MPLGPGSVSAIRKILPAVRPSIDYFYGKLPTGSTVRRAIPSPNVNLHITVIYELQSGLIKTEKERHFRVIKTSPPQCKTYRRVQKESGLNL